MFLNVTSAAVLIGYNAAGSCIYSDCLDLGNYYDGEHVWDTVEGVRQRRLQRVKGYLFDETLISRRSSNASSTVRHHLVPSRERPPPRTVFSI